VTSFLSRAYGTLNRIHNLHALFSDSVGLSSEFKLWLFVNNFWWFFVASTDTVGFYVLFLSVFQDSILFAGDTSSSQTWCCCCCSNNDVTISRYTATDAVQSVITRQQTFGHYYILNLHHSYLPLLTSACTDGWGACVLGINFLIRFDSMMVVISLFSVWSFL